MIVKIKKIDFYMFLLKTYVKILFVVLNNFLSTIMVFILFVNYFFNCLIIITFNHKKQLDIVTQAIIRMIPKHLFSPITKGRDIKNKWTTDPSGNIQNYHMQGFLSTKRSTIAVLTFCILNFLWRLHY